LTALTDQALAQRHLAEIGFADPAFYDFGSDPGHFPARAFHPVTEGTNLYYPATSPGWNYGTGWGTPNASAVVDDFIAYERGSR
jgi:subtilase family serine protease